MRALTSLLIAAFIIHVTPEVIEDDVVIIVCDTGQDSLVQLAVKDNHLEEVRTVPAGSPTAIDYDSVEEHFYFIQYSPSLIKRTDINGENVKTVYNLPGSSYSLAIDEDSRRLFYAGNSNNDIVSMDLTGSNPVTVFDSQTVESPDQIIVHERQKRIIWSDGKGHAKISSSYYDGSDIKKIVDTSVISYGLTLDKNSDILYWTERSPSVIQSIALDGSNRNETYRDQSIYLYDIFLLGNYLYFTGRNLRVHRISVDGGVAQEIPSTTEYGSPWGLYVYSKISYDEEPKVESRLIHTGSQSELLFLCTFSRLSENVSYSTSWFVEDKLVLSSAPEKYSNGSVIENQVLTERRLRDENITAYGIQIACSVTATFEERNVTTTAVRSKKKYVGIRVSTTSVRVTQGESTDIKLSLTDPFGCGNSPKECSLRVKVNTISNPERCEQAVMTPSNCGVSFVSSRWNESISLAFFGKMTSIYGYSSIEVSLNLTSTNDSIHHMWGEALLSQIQVQLTKDTSHIKEKSCHSKNDPHLKTFDGRHYEHQYSGIFTLYMHKDLPIEVQIQTAQCLNSPLAWCNCGVAVRAGRTVFEINRCPGQSDIWFMDYTLCKDGGDVLQVKKRGGDYNIYLPTGGKVVANTYGSFLNLEMFPSVQDTEKSVGLCGKMSKNHACNDDFVLRNGSYSTDPTATEGCNAGYRAWVNELIQFSNSWRVDSQTNLFDHSDLSSLSSWPQQRTFCSCSSDTPNYNLEKNLECSPGKAYENCKSLPGYSGVTPPPSCIVNRRRRRSVREYKEFEPSFHHVNKRDTNTWLGNWTEDAATEHCEQLFKESKSIQICQNITAGETNSSIDDCILDIKLTGTTDFGKYSVDSVRSKCYHEVLVNPVLQDNGTSSSGNQSVYDIVVAEACPGDCSSNGNCSEGTCYCLPNFGGLDCSVDLSAPPVLSSLHDSHCDTSSLSCDFLSVYGETFTDESTCLVEALKVRDTGPELEWSRVSTASVQSISHLKCNISVSKELRDTDYVRVFWISVSNDGTLYSNNVSVLVYDGSCVTGNMIGTDISWTRQDSFCFYAEKCYVNGETRIDDDCKVCIVNGSSTSWENCTDSRTEASTEPTTKATTQTTTEAAALPTTEPTTKATSQPTSEATTLPTTELTTKATTQTTTEATTLPTTELTTKVTTQTTTEPTTKATSQPTSEATTLPTTKLTTTATTQTTTEATTLPTTELTKVTTQTTTEPTTKATTRTTTLATAQPTTEPTTKATTQPTTETTTHSMTESTTDASTQSAREATTLPTTEQTTGTPTHTTKISTTQPTTEASTLPTTELTTKATTQTTTEPTIKATPQSTTLATAQPTTGETTLPTTEPTTKAQSTGESISKAAVESPTEVTTVLTTELPKEATTDGSSTWTTHMTTELPVSDQSYMDFNTITALSVAGGIVAFAVIVAVITFITIKVGKTNNQMKESRLEHPVSADQDPSWRQDESWKQEETWTANHSSRLDNNRMPGRWSAGRKFIPTSYMKRPQF